MQHWFTGISPISVTFLTLSGMCGIAASGSSADRSTVYSSSYSASGSDASGTHTSPRPCASRNALVASSDGKIEVVAPSSAPMLVMVARSGTDRVLTPSPAYSTILPTPPLTVIWRRTSRITSFAETHGDSLPVSVTRTIFGIGM